VKNLRLIAEFPENVEHFEGAVAIGDFAVLVDGLDVGCRPDVLIATCPGA